MIVNLGKTGTGKTGTVSVASCEFAAPAVMRTDDRMRIVWKGHPRLGDDFTATAEGVMQDGAMEWTFALILWEQALPVAAAKFL